MPSLSRRFLAGTVFGLAVSLLVGGARPAAAVGRRLDLATMVQRAGTILHGRITRLREGSHPRYRNIRVLNVTMKVDEALKGTPGDTYTFMQFSGLMGGTAGGKTLSVAQSLPELPAYRVGQEIVLFLYPASRVGFTSPVGGEQGMFLVQRQPGQPTTVISEAGNRSLAVSGSISPRLNPDQQTLLRHPGEAISYATFRATVKALEHSK